MYLKYSGPGFLHNNDILNTEMIKSNIFELDS